MELRARRILSFKLGPVYTEHNIVATTAAGYKALQGTIKHILTEYHFVFLCEFVHAVALLSLLFILIVRVLQLLFIKDYFCRLNSTKVTAELILIFLLYLMCCL